MLRVQDLSAETRAKINHYTLDYLEHEHRQLLWRDLLSRASFVRLRGYTLLLPLSEDEHTAITAERIFLETHRPELVFLLNHQLGQHASTQILTVCHWVSHETFYVTTVFHRCAVSENLFLGRNT